MKKHIILILAMSLMIVLAFAVKDKDNNSTPPMKMQHQNMKGEMGNHMAMMEKLNLTDDQKKQMQTIMTSHKKEMNTMKAELDNLQIDKQNLLKQNKFDDAKKITDQIKTKEATVEKSRIETHKQMWNLLTDDQKKIAKEHKVGMMDFNGPGPEMMKHKEMKKEHMPPRNMEHCEGGNCPMTK